MTPRTCRIAVALAAAALVACAPEVSDTGYAGTWSRGNEIVRSTLAIVESGSGYLVRWTLTSTDGGREVRCDWDGRCEQFSGGELSAEFQLAPTVDPGSGNLFIEGRGTLYTPEGEQEFHFRDELFVRPGHRLVARTREEQGTVYDGRRGPKRTFRKVADTVEDPPRQGAE